jgi:hypothetical protein
LARGLPCERFTSALAVHRSLRVAGQEKTSFRGRDRVAWAFTFAATAYNLVRLPKLIAETG